ncbi:MAG: Crp/Fnr family transcriptional regulator [Pseudomonadota bacterium]
MTTLEGQNFEAEVTVRCLSCGVRDKTLCGALECEELVHINAIATARAFAPGDRLLEEGEGTSSVYNVLGGVVRLSRLLPDGRRAVAGFLFPGDFLGLTIDVASPLTAEAVTAVETCRMERARLNALFKRYPKLEHRLLSMTMSELAAGREHMVLLARKTLRERMATFLVTFADRLAEDPAYPTLLKLPMGRADMADYLGVTVETISRCLAAMAEEGLITLLSPRRISLNAMERLRAIAEDGAEG